MKKSLRLVSLLLALLFLISGAVMIICHAEEEVGGGDDGYSDGGDDTGGDDIGDDDTGGDDTGDDDTGGSDNGGNTGGDYSGGNTNNTGGDDDSDYYVEDDEPMYYGDASDYDYNANAGEEGEAGSVTSNTTLYHSSGMSEVEAAPNKWSAIALDEKKVSTGVTSFKSIKSNTEEEDNGDWMLYLGYVLIGLAVLGILYFIFATIAHSRAVKRAERRQRRSAGYPAAAPAAAKNSEDRPARAPERRTSRFADEPAGKRNRRVSSKADTGEIYVPRRVAKKTR